MPADYTTIDRIKRKVAQDRRVDILAI